MLFNSLHFLLFLPIVVGLYYLLPPKRRWLLIFFASCYFYMVFVPEYIVILFFIILIDYISALTIEQVKGRLRFFYLVASLTANITLLAFFKYFNFINENLAEVFSWFGKDFHPVNLNIILPIGLSFHTFQSMAYTIEVYRGKQKAERHLGYFANYVLFFPQMVAGPIERYDTLGNELREVHYARYDNFANGFRLILFGLFIKMVVADNIAPFVNEIYNDPSRFSSSDIIAAVLLFSFQIYADFFGYSTIALGSARLLGVHIMDNFKTPYLSRSITEFWSRWHISLSSWFRDYLYIPLGGNRVKVPRWCINIMIVFLVSGLWHGASWTFVIWGAAHGIMLLLERFTTHYFKLKLKDGWNILNILMVIKTFLITSFIWIFFRAESFEKAGAVIKGIFSANTGWSNTSGLLVPLAASLIMILFDSYIYNSRFDLRLAKKNKYFRWGMYVFLIYTLMAFSGTQKFTFIYFQF